MQIPNNTIIIIIIIIIMAAAYISKYLQYSNVRMSAQTLMGL